MNNVKINSKWARARSVALFSLITVFSLAVIKVVVGYIGNSIALFADGIHSFSDVLIASLAFLAMKVLSKKPSEKFPYGYYKFEDVLVLVISLTFLMTSLFLAYESIIRIIHYSGVPQVELIAAITAVIAGIISLILSNIQERVAKESHITSLSLNAKEMKYDALASWLVGLSIFINRFIVFPLEEIVSILIAFLILRLSLIGIKEAMLDLLDAWERPELTKKIKKIILSYGDIEGIRTIRLRKAGPLIFGDAIVLVNPRKSIDEIHEILDKIEIEIKKKIPVISDIIIHAEPARKEILKVIIPIDKDDISKAQISDHFGRAPFLALIHISMKEKTYEIVGVEENPHLRREAHAGVKLAKTLGNKDVDAVIVKNIGEASFMALKGLGIRIYRAKESDIIKVIKKFINDELEVLQKPTKE